MAKTQAELAQDLRNVATGLAESNALLAKVLLETGTLQQAIIDLQDALANQTTPSQELQDAVADVASAAGAVTLGIKAVDDKVPDVPVV